VSDEKCNVCGGCVDPAADWSGRLGEKIDALKVLSVLPREPTLGVCFYCVNAATRAAIAALDARRKP
jgi:hypothetical protein